MNIMELPSNNEVKQPQTYYLTPEQIALQGLVDEMIRRADAATFEAFNNILGIIKDE